MVRNQVTAAVVVVGMLGVSACGGGATASEVKAGEVEETGKALVSAAAEEGTVRLYCGAAPDTCEGLAAGFEKAYPDVDVDVLRAKSPDLSARYGSEKKSRARTADVLLHSDIPFIESAVAEGTLTTLAEAGYTAEDHPAEWQVPSGKAAGTPFIAEPIGIAINTKLVPSGQRPRSWSDLTDPRWKSRLSGLHHTASTYGALYGTIDDHVPGFIAGLRTQDVHGDTGGMVPLTEALGAGEYAVQTLASPVVVQSARERGAPVEFIYPEPGVTGSSFLYTLNPEPEHPSAQKLLAQWATSKAGSEAAAGDGDGAVAAHIETDFEFFPPVFAYYDPERKQDVVDRMEAEK